MKLYERFGERGYHTSIITTFGLDFDTYENVVLARLKGAGCNNNILLCDAALLTQSLAGLSSLPRTAGRHYTVNSAYAPGAFHPKLVVQLGRNGGRIIVSSANMTATGLAGNLELAEEIACSTEDSGEQLLVAQAWRYALRHCDRTGQALDAQIAWAESRAPWLRRALPATDSVSLSDGSIAALLTTGESAGIGKRFAALLGDDSVRRLVVVSPYWDPNLRALSTIAKALSVSNVDLLIDADARLFPVSALKKVKGARLFDRDSFRKGRFLHAKILIAQTRKADHVLYGSANCTLAALGAKGFAGSNEEVSMYRRLPPGAILDRLELKELLNPNREVDPDDLDEVDDANSVDLDFWRGRAIGRFECNYGTLTWTPPPGLDPDAVSITLLDTDQKELGCRLGPAEVRGDVRRYEVLGAVQRPAFAALLFSDGTRSAPAIVTLVDRIQEEAREARSKQTEEAVSQLNEETDESLLLLDILDTIESAERLLQTVEERPSVRLARKTSREPSNAPGRFRTMTYEEFIAGRRARTDGASIGRSSLSASEASLVRSFLNRIIGVGIDDAAPGIDTERDLDKAFDLGDEAVNAEDATTRGDSFEPGAGDLSSDDEQREALRKKAAQRKSTREHIAAAVAAFSKRISQRKKDGALTTFDVLRLRALLMIVAAAGWNGSDAAGAAHPARTSLQVLAVEGGGDSWPWLMGRILFCFFGSPDPAIRHLNLDALHDQFTDDILECWATCCWCLHACLSAPCSKNERAALAKRILPLGEKTYRLTGMNEAELNDEGFVLLMTRLSERFRIRLGLDAKTLAEGHQSMLRAIFNRVTASVHGAPTSAQ